MRNFKLDKAASCSIENFELAVSECVQVNPNNSRAMSVLTYYHSNSEACEWCHDSDKTQTNKLEWWRILKISLRAKAGVPKTLVKRKVRLHSLCFPQKMLMLTESCREFSDLHSIFRLRVLHYWIHYKS